MAMAGVDRWLTAAEIEAICQHYTAPKTASMDVMHYTQFLADVDEIFTKPVSCCLSMACGLSLACTAGPSWMCHLRCNCKS
jgi:hypothetical protein